jgi:RNA polymerase sigma factor (sigma-70 family)
MSTSNDDQDRSLLAYIAAGDQQAFWTLWLRHRPTLFAVCLREFDGNRVDAEDALGQAMLRARQKLPRFAASVGNVRSWMARVTSNVCRDIQRARARDARTEEQLARQEGERCRELLYTSPREELVPVGSDLDVDPVSLIARLPDRLRGVFVQRVIQNQPYEAIAASFAITGVTARKRVQEARARLRGWRYQPPVTINSDTANREYGT